MSLVHNNNCKCLQCLTHCSNVSITSSNPTTLCCCPTCPPGPTGPSGPQGVPGISCGGSSILFPLITAQLDQCVVGSNFNTTAIFPGNVFPSTVTARPGIHLNKSGLVLVSYCSTVTCVPVSIIPIGAAPATISILYTPDGGCTGQTIRIIPGSTVIIPMQIASSLICNTIFFNIPCSGTLTLQLCAGGVCQVVTATDSSFNVSLLNC